MDITRRTLVGGIGAAALVGAGPAYSQAYPDKPITLIIPFAPGGGTDVLARILAPVLAIKLGGTVIIETVSGAAGNMGSTRLARSAPDGYTLLLHNVGYAINAALYQNLPFDSERDLTPVAFASDSPLLIVGRKTLPAQTLPELIAWMKDNDAKVAHAGVGSASHMGIVPLVRAAGRGDLIPYRGGGPAMQDVIGGHADVTAQPLQSGISAVEEGLAKGFAVTTAERSPVMPNLPSLGEVLGPKSLTNFWSLLLTRTGTPTPITDKLRTALDAALVDPQLRAAFLKAGVTVSPEENRKPDVAKALLHKEIEHWREVVRENNIQAP